MPSTTFPRVHEGSYATAAELEAMPERYARNVGTPVAGPVEREMDIPAEILMLENATSELEAVVEVMLQRLAPVMRQSGQVSPDEALDTVRAPLANRIREQRRRMQNATERLSRAVGELEL